MLRPVRLPRRSGGLSGDCGLAGAREGKLLASESALTFSSDSAGLVARAFFGSKPVRSRSCSAPSSKMLAQLVISSHLRALDRLLGLGPADAVDHFCREGAGIDHGGLKAADLLRIEASYPAAEREDGAEGLALDDLDLEELGRRGVRAGPAHGAGTWF